MKKAFAEPPAGASHACDWRGGAGREEADGQVSEPNSTAALQIDPNDLKDHYVDSHVTITSVTTSIRDYVYENGRRYHAYREGEYLIPNDEKEQDRLDLIHHVFRLVLGGALYRAPLPRTVRRVLDLGTGTGIWAIDFADEHPNSIVLGNDLSPIQPLWVPENCKFIVDDIESDWLYTPDEAFDYIHGRGLGGSVKDWPRLYNQIYDNLIPGGWLEMQEYEAWIKSDDDPQLLNAPFVLQWMKLIDEASAKFGKRFNIAENVEQWFKDAGFEDVRDDRYMTPIGTWSSDPKLKEIGLYQLEQMCDAVESFTLAVLTRILGWGYAECEVLVANVRRDFRNKKNHLYSVRHFVYGRKPARIT